MKELSSTFPECRSFNLDNKTHDVTFRHLLTMTSGLDCSDQRPKGYFRSENWTRFYLERKITHIPGTKFRYSSASSNLLSVLLYKLTSLNVYDFAKNNLFTPLSISRSEWSYDKQGFYHGGFGLDLVSNDITKLGLLYLNNGMIGKTRLLSEAYIGQATRAYSKGGFPEKDAYGFQWWVGTDLNTPYFYAAGLGGQYLFIVPRYNLIVTITSDSRRPHIENKTIFKDLILPSYGDSLF